MVIDQNKLNTEGTLEVRFDLENVGGADANNIDLTFPLGPDFNKIVQSPLKIYTIKDAYELDEGFESLYNITFSSTPTVPGVNSLNFRALNVTGWYVNAGTSDPAVWDTRSFYDLINVDVSVLGIGTVNFKFSLTSTNGFPAAFVSALDTLKVGMPAIAAASDVQPALDYIKSNFGGVLKTTFNESFHAVYEEQSIFDLDEGDFTYGPRTVAINEDTTRTEWFVNTTIDELTAGSSTSVAFRINNVPVETDVFALMGFIPSQDETGYPSATLVSSEQDYYDFMQYAFELVGFDGRPISFGLPDDFSFGLASYHSNVYGSMGLAFTYTNDAGYPFFGLSNGQNVQIADDEAIVSATVELDKQLYLVGDPVEITVDLSNNGDLTATDIKVNLFHGTLGRDNRFERIDLIDTLDASDLTAGNTATLTWNGEANSYLGYHTVFAIVEFTSDAGQGPEEVTDFFDIGVNSYEAGGETDHFVMSTLSGALLMPQDFTASPSIPEPLLVITTEVIGDGVTTDALTISAGETFTYRLTVLNDGEASTTALVGQAYSTTDLEVLSVDPSKGTVTQDSNGLVKVEGIELAKDESMTIDIEFRLLTDEAVLPAAFAEYSTNGESSLGSTVDTGVDVTVSSTGGSALLPSAGSAAQQQSQKSGSADASSNAFSSSSSVGASAQNNEDTDKTVVDGGPGFVGPSSADLMIFMVAPIAIFAILRKRK
jgi:hypothetical protein